MAVLSVNGIYKSFGASTILEDVSFSVNKNEKIAIVGDNGQGKTTLLKIITGELQQDKGSVYFEEPNSYGYLSQQVIDDESHTLLEEMRLSFKKIIKLEKEMKELLTEMENNPDINLVDKYSKIHDQYISLGGYEYEYQIQQMLSKFGFDESYHNRQLKTFSGGEKTRALFVKLLLNKPSILLLDEPTNHLDLIMIEWLEKYLKSYSGTVILVSHDQIFIDNIVNKVLEIENHKATMYSGNYSYYLNEKQVRYEQLMKAYNVQSKERARYEMLIRKFKYKPTKASFAKSLEKKLDKMEVIEKPNNKKKTIKATFKANLDEVNVKMHICENLLFGYDNNPLTEPLNLEIRNQDKICIMGQNGSGKTTLLKCLMNNENLISGFNSDVRVNLKHFYFDQTQKILDEEMTLFDTIHEEFPLFDNTQVRNVLGRFLFEDDDAFKTVKNLSGGEKIRLIFALISLRNYDVLYLDEPTNHLDFTTKRVVSDILEDYPGTIIMVSHDRYFVNRVANKIIYMQNKKYIIEKGNYENFIKYHNILDLGEVSLNQKYEKEKKAKEKSVNKVAKKDEKKEKRIEEILTQIDKINEQMSSEDNDYSWQEYHEFEKQIEQLEKELEELE